MSAVFKRELASYFSGVTGYIFGAFLLLFAGIYVTAYNLQGGRADFSSVLSSMTMIFLIIVPVLTMRVLAEERRQKTDQLLYSLPLSMAQVVLGKFGAMVTVLLLPMAIIATYPLMLTAFGSVYLPAAYTGILGFFCLGIALLAIGMYVSSLTESQPMAAGLCFAVMLLNYFIAGLATFIPSTAVASLICFAVVAVLLGVIVYVMTKNSTAAMLTGVVLAGAAGGVYLWKSDIFVGAFPKLLNKLSLFEQFYTMLEGVFDLRSILYLLSVCAVFLFLSVQSMEKRRWSA